MSGEEEETREGSIGRMRPQGKIELITVLKPKISLSSVHHSEQE
jgi:hypothetical protein